MEADHAVHLWFEFSAKMIKDISKHNEVSQEAHAFKTLLLQSSKKLIHFYNGQLLGSYYVSKTSRES